MLLKAIFKILNEKLQRDKPQKMKLRNAIRRIIETVIDRLILK